MTKIANSVMLITGAAGGFGYELTRQSLALGAKLILTDIDLPKLETMADGFLQSTISGEILATYHADLSTYEGVQELFNTVTQAGYQPDILINNAGVGMFGRYDHLPPERIEQLMQINLLAPMRLTHLFLPDMIDRNSGHIVNISSLAGWVGTMGLAPYNAAKFGLRGFSEGLMEDLKDFDIQVTTVYPFFSKTAILDSPQYGTVEQRELPDDMLTDPADVMAEVIKGIQNNTPHVFPDSTAKVAHLLKRYFPSALRFLNNWLERRSSDG